ncbi:MFS transporter [Streptomyces sp. NPDC052042]|uniref:MFS transporter n=1 Tax=Streptomyces sp. NPDC052042 TaxID=3365683 RepID=UPI0037D2FD73
MGRRPRLGGWRVTGPRAFLLAASFLITLGSFAVLPYVSVLLHQRLGLGLGTVGIVLAVASLVQFSGGVAAGALAGRIGLRATMLTALAVRTAGFAAFVPGMTSPVLAVGAVFLVSCGAALYLPANKAYLVEGADEADRPRLLSASGAAFNAGIALGPPAAAPFVLGSPTVLFSCVTALFALVGIGHALLPPAAVRPVADEAREAAGDADRLCRHDDGLPPFAVTVLSVYVFMFFQHYLALYAVPRTSVAYYGAVLTGYACLLVVAQPLLSRWIAALAYRDTMKVGFGSMAAGTAAIAYGGHTGIGAGAALMCVGEVVLFLKNDLEALARSSAAPASVFGRQRLAAGLGAFGSGVVGGQVYAGAEAMGSARGFWLAVCLQALLLPALLTGVVRRRRIGTGAAIPEPGGERSSSRRQRPPRG